MPYSMKELFSIKKNLSLTLPFWPMLSLSVIVVSSRLLGKELMLIIGSWSVLNAKSFLLSYFFGFNMETYLLKVTGKENLLGFSLIVGSIMVVVGLIFPICFWIISLVLFRYYVYFLAYNDVFKLLVLSVIIRYLLLPYLFVKDVSPIYIVIPGIIGLIGYVNIRVKTGILSYLAQAACSWNIILYNGVKYLRNYGDKLVLSRIIALDQLGFIDLIQKGGSILGLLNASAIEKRKKALSVSKEYSFKYPQLVVIILIYVCSLLICFTSLRSVSPLLSVMMNTWISLPFFVWNRTIELSKITLFMIVPFAMIFLIKTTFILYMWMTICEIGFGVLLFVRNYKFINGRHTVKKIHLS